MVLRKLDQFVNNSAMKKILLILNFLACIRFIKCDGENETSNCDQFLSEKQKIQECCNIPSSIDIGLQQSCYARCSGGPPSQLDDCALECYLTSTMLLDRDRKVDKISAKRIYKNNIYNDETWLKVIDESVDKCDYEVSEDIEHNLMKFFNCVDDFLTDNCTSFLQSPICEPIEEEFEKCKGKSVDCSTWPCNFVNVQSCCKTPQIYSPNLIEKCSFECQKKELLMRKRSECNFNCTMIDTGLLVDGKFNFETVKKLLMASTNKSEEWEKQIDVAISSCEGRFKGNDFLYDQKLF